MHIVQGKGQGVRVHYNNQDSYVLNFTFSQSIITSHYPSVSVLTSQNQTRE